MEGKKRRERPRTQYMDNIRQWSGLSVDQINCKTRDRKTCRQISNGVGQSSAMNMPEEEEEEEGNEH